MKTKILTLLTLAFSLSVATAAEEAPAHKKHEGHSHARAKLLKSMNLTEEQRKALRKIFEARKAEVEALGGIKGNLDKVKAIMEKYDPQIKAIIGEANFKKLLTLREARMAKRKAHHQKRGGEKPAE